MIISDSVQLGRPRLVKPCQCVFDFIVCMLLGCVTQITLNEVLEKEHHLFNKLSANNQQHEIYMFFPG